MVGGLSNNLINNASAVDLAGLGSTTRSNSGYLRSSNSFSTNATGMLGDHAFELSSPIFDYDYTSNALDRVGSLGLKYSDTILISNLPPNTTWKILCDKFCNIGDVKLAEMKGKDMGIVRYSSRRDAERAVSLLDGTRFDGYVIDVCLF